MNKEFIMNILHEQECELERKYGYKVAYICVYGSQNYGLDIYTNDYKSDLDLKAVILPNLDDLIYDSKPISTKHVYEFGEIDVKDVRVYIDTLVKANPAYLETIYTDYFIIDSDFQEEFQEIRNMRDQLVYSLKPMFIKAIYGMMLDRKNNMLHLTSSSKDKIEKYGFSGKDASHCIRLFYLMKHYFLDGNKIDFNINDINEKELIIKYKLNNISLIEAEENINSCMDEALTIRNTYLQNFGENVSLYFKNKIVKYSRDIIKKNIIKNIK